MPNKTKLRTHVRNDKANVVKEQRELKKANKGTKDAEKAEVAAEDNAEKFNQVAANHGKIPDSTQRHAAAAAHKAAAAALKAQMKAKKEAKKQEKAKKWKADLSKTHLPEGMAGMWKSGSDEVAFGNGKH